MFGQHMRWQFGKRFAVSAMVLLLTACGGGTSDDSSGQPTSSSGGSSSGGSGGGAALATGTYDISWDAVADAAVTGYRVYFDSAPLGSGRTPLHVDVSGPTVALSPGAYGVRVGDTLYVAVASRGSGGAESPVSSQVSIAVD